MIGLISLIAIGLWVFLSFYVPLKIPGWFGMQRYGGVVTIILIPLMLGAMFIDEIIGMRQFERLCKERAVVWVSPDAGQVRRTKKPEQQITYLSGYLVSIETWKTTYLNVDTNKPFFTYETLLTKGGRVASITLMGGTHSCKPTNLIETYAELDIDKLIDQGRKP